MLTAVYVVTAIVLIPSIFVAAEWIGHDNSPQPAQRLMYSVLAAVLWPLLVVGMIQFGVIVAIRRIIRSRVSAAATPVVDVVGQDVDTVQMPVLSVPYIRVGTPAI